MKIIQLNSQNVKRLTAVQIKPDGSLVVIGGRNAQGKSSVIDSIQYALGGEPQDRMPVRRGAEKASIVVDLGEIVVKRTFTAAGGSSLVVEDADGKRQSSPQTILDKLIGKLAFDPLEFARQKPKQQADTLKALLGLDFSKQDAERQKAFDERTVVNRDAKALEARMAALPKHDKVPDKETSTADVLKEQQAAAARNAANQSVRTAAATAANQSALADADLEAAQVTVAELEKELISAREVVAARSKTAKEAHRKADSLNADAAALTDEDLTPFTTKLAEVEATNRKVRENFQRAEIVKQFKAKTAEADKLTAQIEEIETAKRKAVTESAFPIEGMGFDAAGGVTLAGIPFEQASSAEQLRVSVAIGLALNPKLRVLLIRDGSLLDEDSLKLVAEMADTAKAQVWIERVGTDGQTSVVIEDGHVLAPEPKPEGSLL